MTHGHLGLRLQQDEQTGGNQNLPVQNPRAENAHAGPSRQLNARAPDSTMGDDENNENEDHSHWEKELERLAKEVDTIKEKIMGAW